MGEISVLSEVPLSWESDVIYTKCRWFEFGKHKGHSQELQKVQQMK